MTKVQISFHIFPIFFPKEKCGPKAGAIWPFILSEVKPALEELGISSPEEIVQFLNLRLMPHLVVGGHT